MKSFTAMFLGLAALSSMTSAAPTVHDALTSPARREQYANNVAFAQDLVQKLLVDVKAHAITIDAIAHSIDSTSDLAHNTTAKTSARKEIVAITSAVNKAKAQTASVAVAGGYGQSAESDAGAVAALLKELLNAVNAAVANLENALGLGALGDLLQPLDTAIDGLVLGLGSIVDGLLKIVAGLLGGLTGAIGGLLGGLLGGLGS